ncbi:MAG: AraC family transcriptional regulator [Nibricoccus sp.]
MAKVSRPLSITLPSSGVAFAESDHAWDFKMSARTDPYHKLLYVLQGDVRYLEAGQKEQSAAQSTLLAIPMGITHTLADRRPSTLLLFCFDDTFLQSEPELAQVWQQLTSAKSKALKPSQPLCLQLESLWRRALLEQVHTRPGAPAALRALALQMLVALARLPSRQKPEQTASRIAAVAQEMVDTFYDPWTLDIAAARAAMSRRHFSAQFRRVVGRSFSEHLTNLRMEHAATLLRANRHSIAGAIFACGFGDISHFYRLFRARFGAPPKQWQQLFSKPRR